MNKAHFIIGKNLCQITDCHSPSPNQFNRPIFKKFHPHHLLMTYYIVLSRKPELTVSVPQSVESQCAHSTASRVTCSLKFNIGVSSRARICKHLLNRCLLMAKNQITTSSLSFTTTVTRRYNLELLF